MANFKLEILGDIYIVRNGQNCVKFFNKQTARRFYTVANIASNKGLTRLEGEFKNAYQQLLK